MSNNFYEFERNNELSGISHELQGIKNSIKDQTYLQAYGKEAYLEMIEKRRFRHQLLWCGAGAFLVGFFGVGLYLNNWDMNALINQLVDIFENLFMRGI